MRTALNVVLVVGAVVTLAVISGGKAEAESVVSSWYGPGLEGNPTASGEIFSSDARTAAHPSLPFGTKLLVTYGGQQTVVRVTDRGPFVSGRGLDLSHGAAKEIGLTNAGADEVDVKVLDGSGDYDESNPPEEYSPQTSQGENPSKEYSPRKERATREGSEGIAAFLRERPYLRVLGAAAPYPRPSTKGCQEASMTTLTPRAGTRLPSVESTKARIVAAGALCSPKMRRL
ncbi:MAG: septal ring lytic transglycosylase RlpA family protein [Actinobacteria bacterium]|nr:septal ring lytic transglycosylase RlpA family protein [Actinomycetota bacterium]